MQHIEPNYLAGFCNIHQSEAEAGACPPAQNSPQHHPLGLYTEQLTGTAFTTPRHEHRASWLYRLRPSVGHSQYIAYQRPTQSNEKLVAPIPPDALRWDPLPQPDKATHFVDGMRKMASCGHPQQKLGAAIYHYAINQGMANTYYSSADGEYLLIPQSGDLAIPTEFGTLHVSPGEIAVIPRGVKFQVNPLQTSAHGYLCENYGSLFELPELGPIGGQGLANPRHFLYPTAHYENTQQDVVLINKFADHYWQCSQTHSPFDVVAWHGNYAPYKYNLARFNTMNTVSYDHPDPSIFTVLTAKTWPIGTANVDFVVFPERWMVAENTFRPPYFHRNAMSEYMGLISGQYDAKADGFKPGGASLHNCMTAHGPDKKSYQSAIQKPLKPVKYTNILAFMFESNLLWQPTEFALNAKFRQQNYLDCWHGFD